VLRSSNEPAELSQTNSVHCQDDSTINVVLAVTVAVTVTLHNICKLSVLLHARFPLFLFSFSLSLSFFMCVLTVSSVGISLNTRGSYVEVKTLASYLVLGHEPSRPQIVRFLCHLRVAQTDI